jgi:hypothetical protein
VQGFHIRDALSVVAAQHPNLIANTVATPWRRV